MRPLDLATNIVTIPVGPPGRQGATGARGQVGPQGRQGLTGLKGEPGRQIVQTTGVPNAGLGSNGDFALDTTNFLIYGPKTNNDWGTGKPYGVANPRHVWSGTSLALYNADGTLGQSVNLAGPVGPSGGPIPAGGTPGQYPSPKSGGGYEWLFPPSPFQIAPIEITSPVANGTVAGTQTFVAKLAGYSADTVGFYSGSGIPQAKRGINFYRTSAPSVIWKSFEETGPGNSITVGLRAAGFATSTQYLAEMVFTDVLGNVTKSPKLAFVTAASLRPVAGESYQGGFFTGQIVDNGSTYDLIVAPRSGGQTTATWDNQTSSANNKRSRTDGLGNTVVSYTTTRYLAHKFCDELVLNGYSDWYLPAIDELETAYRNLKPTTDNNSAGEGVNNNSVPTGAVYTTTNPSQTSVAAFKVGGAEAFPTDNWHWTSTEASASSAIGKIFSAGSENNGLTKTSSYYVRAFRRVAA